MQLGKLGREGSVRILGTLLVATVSAGSVLLSCQSAEAQRCNNCVRGPIQWGNIRMAPPRQQRTFAIPSGSGYQAQRGVYGPMAGSTPMVARRTGPPVPYGNIATRAGRFVAGTKTGNYLVSKGYPVAGKVIKLGRGGPAGALFYPSCAGEGCSGWKGKIFP